MDHNKFLKKLNTFGYSGRKSTISNSFNRMVYHFIKVHHIVYIDFCIKKYRKFPYISHSFKVFPPDNESISGVKITIYGIVDHPEMFLSLDDCLEYLLKKNLVNDESIRDFKLKKLLKYKTN